jgi:hypothetical protein
VVHTKRITDQQMMGLDTSDLHALLLTYPELHQGDLGKQGPLNFSQFVEGQNGPSL